VRERETHLAAEDRQAFERQRLARLGEEDGRRATSLGVGRVDAVDDGERLRRRAGPGVDRARRDEAPEDRAFADRRSDLDAAHLQLAQVCEGDESVSMQKKRGRMDESR